MNDHSRLVAEALRQGLIEESPAEFTIAGTSMVPYLRQGDRVRLKPCDPRSLQGGHCYAFREGAGLVLHRYVATHGEYAILIGDNMLVPQVVPLSNIIGELTGSAAQSRVRSIQMVNRLFIFLHRVRRFVIRRLAGTRRHGYEEKI
jgi:signal peptidase I